MTTPEPTVAGRRTLGAAESAHAARTWWDADADNYQAAHGADLGDVRFQWGPEGLDEAQAHLLGDVTGKRVLEVGSGAGQCARWLVTRGAFPVAVDIALEQVRWSRRLDERTGVWVPAVVADGAVLPLRSASVDLACSAYGAVPFVGDLVALHREIARVVRPGGRWVFSTSHPVRWCFDDEPDAEGLVARHSYWDRRAYVETDATGTPVYVEQHRTLGDHVRALVAAGWDLVDVVEPEWPAQRTVIWGGWSPERGRILPGTTIFVAALPR